MQQPTTSPTIKPAKKQTLVSLFEDTIGQVSMPQRGSAADYRDEVTPPQVRHRTWVLAQKGVASLT